MSGTNKLTHKGIYFPINVCHLMAEHVSVVTFLFMQIIVNGQSLRVEKTKDIIGILNFCYFWGQGKPTAHISTNFNRLPAFRYPPPPTCWLYASGGKRKVVDVRREVCTLIYPDPYFWVENLTPSKNSN